MYYEVIAEYKIIFHTESKSLAIYKALLWGNGYVWEIKNKSDYSCENVFP
jgi:hypothetical protein